MEAIVYAEIEEALLLVAEARERAERATRTLVRSAAEPHLVEALAEADEELLAVHRRLMERAYFAVPGERQLALDAT